MLVIWGKMDAKGQIHRRECLLTCNFVCCITFKKTRFFVCALCMKRYEPQSDASVSAVFPTGPSLQITSSQQIDVCIYNCLGTIARETKTLASPHSIPHPKELRRHAGRTRGRGLGGTLIPFRYCTTAELALGHCHRRRPRPSVAFAAVT